MDSFPVFFSNFTNHLQQTHTFDQVLSLILTPFAPVLLPYTAVQTYLQTTDPLYSAILLCCMFTFGSWFLSIVNGNWSQVDRLWSLMPVCYVWHFLWKSGLLASVSLASFWTSRPHIMALMVTLWGLRLSYNFYRKGGYSRGHEDYRWPAMREGFGWNPVTLQLFNFSFIAVFQNILIFLFSAPIYAAIFNPGPLNNYDYGGIAVWFILFAIEVTADEQQWAFQTRKASLRSRNLPLTGDYADGFLKSGLFRYCRHPNFLGEYSMWWAYYFLSYNAIGHHWLVAGTAMLTALFHFSTNYTEELTVARYGQKYIDYQNKVWKGVP